MSTYYYVYPFAINADDTPVVIPPTPPVDGSVSYQGGWTPPYEYNLLTNPAAFPIPRNVMNQLFYDITNNLQEYQQYGTPSWITAAQNLGTPFPYPIYARVYYNNVVYENQVANNTATPGTDSTWTVISGGQQGVSVGMMIDFAGTVAPAGYLLCDGSAVSRTTYSALLGVISFTQNGTTTNTMNTVSGLTSTANMYVGMHVEGTNIPTGTTIASIVDATDITLSNNATGSGTVSIQFFSWGNGDGSTTFNVPDYRRRTSMGSGGTGTATIGNVVGQSGGEENHTLTIGEMPNHTHTAQVSQADTTVTTGRPFFGFGDNAAPGSTATTNANGGNAGHNTIQPSNICYKIIKT